MPPVPDRTEGRCRLCLLATLMSSFELSARSLAEDHTRSMCLRGRAHQSHLSAREIARLCSRRKPEESASALSPPPSSRRHMVKDGTFYEDLISEPLISIIDCPRRKRGANGDFPRIDWAVIEAICSRPRRYRSNPAAADRGGTFRCARHTCHRARRCRSVRQPCGKVRLLRLLAPNLVRGKALTFWR
jgi:hypothetical protein